LVFLWAFLVFFDCLLCFVVVFVLLLVVCDRPPSSAAGQSRRPLGAPWSSATRNIPECRTPLQEPINDARDVGPTNSSATAQRRNLGKPDRGEAIAPWAFDKL